MEVGKNLSNLSLCSHTTFCYQMAFASLTIRTERGYGKKWVKIGNIVLEFSNKKQNISWTDKRCITEIIVVVPAKLSNQICKVRTIRFDRMSKKTSKLSNQSSIETLQSTIHFRCLILTIKHWPSNRLWSKMTQTF